MTHIQTVAAAFAIAGMAMASPAASPQTKPDDERAVGSKVTIMTCVEKGQKADTFLMTNVAAVPVHAESHGRVVYWFDTVKPLRAHVGHQVRIMGSITDVDSEEMEVKLGEDGKGGWTVEVEGPGQNVRATAAQAGVATAGRESGKNDIKTTLVKVKIDNVTMVAASCPTM
jgi:hypothetical protein